METGNRIAHYQILGRLGAGGMGEVYRARDTRLERDVAIKVLPPDFAQSPTRVARFEREARLLASLNHPNIATIYELREVDGRTLLVLELVEGEPLDRRLERIGALPVDEVLQIGRQIASALEAAHERGIVHRDLKPANVMLGPKDTVKVLDFGVAQGPATSPGESGAALQVDEEDTGVVDKRDPEVAAAHTMATRLTSAGALLGTGPYMSPEQVLGARIDKRSDIWSFGCLMFELLVGDPAFQGESLASTLTAVLTQEPDWDRLPPELTPGFERLLHRCLRKDADLRLHDIADARIVIDELTESEAPWRTRPRRPAALAQVMTLALAVLVLGVLAFDVAGIRERLLGGSGGASLEAIASVVSLPAEVTSIDQEPAGLFLERGADVPYAYLADAVPAMLATMLGRVPGLVTRHPPTSMELASIDGDLDELADLYEVAAFIMPTLTTSGDTLHLALQLLDSRTRSSLWSADFTGPWQEYDAILHRAADALRRALRPRAPPLVQGESIGSTNTTAELDFRRGRHHSDRYRFYHDVADFELARSAFEQALEADPGLADAAAEMAVLYGTRIQLGHASPEAWTEMEKSAKRAQAIDPSAGLAWAVRAGMEAFYRREGSQRTRLVYALRGATLAPHRAIAQNSLGAVLTDYSLSLGAESFRAAVEIQPLLLSARTNLVASLTTAGRLREALAAIDEARQIQSAQQWAAEMTEGSILSMLGRTAEARPIVDRLESLVEGGALPPVALLELQLEFALASGNRQEAEAHLATIVEVLQSPEVPPQLIWNLVVSSSSALAVAGMLDSSFRILKLGMDRGVLVPYDYLELNSRLAALRGDPRYGEIAAPARARFEEFKAILGEARLRGELPTYLEPPLEVLSTQLEGR